MAKRKGAKSKARKSEELLGARKDYRLFGGKKYYLEAIGHTNLIKDHAAKMQRQGYYTRVVPTSTGGSRLWIRKRR
jgi:hypothetical protein